MKCMMYAVPFLFFFNVYSEKISDNRRMHCVYAACETIKEHSVPWLKRNANPGINNNSTYYCDADCLDEYGDDWELYFIQYIQCVRSKNKPTQTYMTQPTEVILSAQTSNQKVSPLIVEVPKPIEHIVPVVYIPVNIPAVQEKKQKKQIIESNKEEALDYYLSTGMSDDDVAAIRNNK